MQQSWCSLLLLARCARRQEARTRARRGALAPTT
jgi:hypothetical protein